MAPQDVFHPIFELQFLFLEGDFFELLGFGEVLLGGQFVQAIFQFVMLGRETMKFLVGPQQLCLQILRLCIHAPPPWTSVLRLLGHPLRTYHKLCGDSRSAVGLRQILAPEDQSVFDRLRVVGAPHSRDCEPKALVQQAGRVVRSTHLEGGAPGAPRRTLLQDAVQQRRCHTGPPESRENRQIVDVELVEHPPEGTKPDHLAAGSFCEETEGHAGVLELRLVHHTRPGVRERRLLDGQHTVNLRGGHERVDHPRGHLLFSLAISASGRRTYNGRTPAGSSAADARAIASRPTVPASRGCGMTRAPPTSRAISCAYMIAPSPMKTAGISPTSARHRASVDTGSPTAGPATSSSRDSPNRAAPVTRWTAA